MYRNVLGPACRLASRNTWLALAIAALPVFPQIAQANEITLNLNFQNIVDPIGADYVGLFTGDPGTSNFDFAGVAALAPIPVGDSSQSIIIGPAAISQTLPADLNDITGIAFLGVYDPTSADPGLTIGVAASAASNYLGKSYAAAFPESSITEATAVTGLLASDINTVGTVPVIPDDENYGFKIGDPGEFINFSDGTVGGTLTTALAPVPEPPTIALLAAGLLCLSLMRRRRISYSSS
jgi:PEP-CTERM motif